MTATAPDIADQLAERFTRDTADHVMKVRRDDGLYRHVEFRRFAPPREGEPACLSSLYWFDLVTWPHCLAVNGDCGSFMFSRIEDMFGFFRGSRINPDYWAEKVRGETRTRCYSSDKFRRHVTEAALEAEQYWPGLTQAAERDIFGAYSQWNTEFEGGAREALRDFEFRPPGLDATAEGFRFSHSWEWDLRDWDWQFLWCLHAIQWGIGQYDSNAKAAAALLAEEVPAP